MRQLEGFFRLLALIVSLLLLVGPSTVAALDSAVQLQTPFYEPSNTTTCSTTLVGNDNIQRTINYLEGKGLPFDAAAGIIGNMEAESGTGIDPTAEQTPGASWTDMGSDDTEQHGVGIVQWDGPRRPAFIRYAESHGLTLQDLQNGNPQDLSVELDYVWFELTTGHTGTYAQMQKETDVEQATFDWLKGFEDGFATKTDTFNWPQRLDYAQKVVEQYAGGESAGAPTSSCASSVDCNNSSQAASNLSQVRQDVVCEAEQELAIWKAQPGYPWDGENSYSQTGYLKYSDNNAEEWCADFVSWLYQQAGYPFSGGASGGWRIPAVSSIESLGQQEGNFHWHTQGDGYTPKPGDIAIIGVGAHTELLVSSSGGAGSYIGGDEGIGPYPGGSIVQQDTYGEYYDGGVVGYVSPD